MSSDLKKPNSPNGTPLRVELKKISRSQAGVRHRPEQLASLRTYLKANENRFPAPVAINRFEDGTYYLRDGHGRLAVAEELGVLVLEEGRDFVLETYTYSQYATTELSEGWTTPFDPRIHLRLAELGGYKRLIASFVEDGVSEAKLIEFIDAHPEAYRVTRPEAPKPLPFSAVKPAVGQGKPLGKRVRVDGPDCVAKAIALAEAFPDVCVVGDCTDLLSVRQAQESASGPNLVFLCQAKRAWPLA